MDNVKIVNEVDNPLFKRKEIEFTCTSEVNPSKDEVDKFLSEKYKSDPFKIRIKKIGSKFGSKDFTISANIYETEKDMFETERFSKKEKEKIKKIQEEKNKLAKPEEKEEAKSEEKSVENAPKQEKTEDKKE